MTESLRFTLPPSPDELADEAERYQVQRTAAEQEQRLKRAAALAWRLVPAAFNFPTPDLIGRCARPLAARVTSVDTVAALLIGPTKSGKSTAAAVLVRRALHDYVHSQGKRFACAIDLVWTTAVDLALAERRHPLGAGEPPLLLQASTCGLLVLDDLGLEPEGAVFPVLSQRYHACRPTITTSGLTTSGLSKHLGAAGARRLHDQHAAGMPVLFVDCHEKKSSPAKNTTGGRP